MRIQDYSFGKMNISGKEYTNDLKVFPEKVKPNWWRKKGHQLQVDDVQDIIDYGPDLVVIGTGRSGRMDVSEELLGRFEKEKIKVVVKKTDEAVAEFNKRENAVGAFHLTC